MPEFDDPLPKTSPLRILRTVAAVAVAVWGFYIVTLMRTQSFGLSPASLYIAAVFVLPAAILVTLGLPRRAFLRRVAALLLVATGSAELFAGIEERRFKARVRSLPALTQTYRQARAWPFDNHDLFYDPATKSFRAGD